MSVFPTLVHLLILSVLDEIFKLWRSITYNLLLSSVYESLSKSFRTESMTKYTLTLGITRWEVTQRVMETKLTRLTHKISIQLYLTAERFTIWSSPSRWPVRKLLDRPSYYLVYAWTLPSAFYSRMYSVRLHVTDQLHSCYRSQMHTAESRI